MNAIEKLINHLKSNTYRLELSERLGNVDGILCAYYICSQETVLSILKDGILPREKVGDNIIDLSSHEVQNRRIKTWVGRDTQPPRFIKEKSIHSCINMFCNPINWTLIAFQRNALIRNYGSSKIRQSLCIVEINAEKILTDEENYYAFTNRNIASGGFSSYKTEKIIEFPWNDIYSPNQPETSDQNRNRSAEFIVYRGNFREKDLPSNPIAVNMITRVITNGNQSTSTELLQALTNKGIPHSDSTIFKSIPELFDMERLFFYNLSKLYNIDANCIGHITQAFGLITQFEHRIFGPVCEEFDNADIAFSVHGTGHIVRVMFWCAYFGGMCQGHLRHNLLFN